MFKPECVVVTARSALADELELAQGISSSGGISFESAGSIGLCAHIVTIPIGGRGKAHVHPEHESVVYIIQGSVATWFGDDLRSCATAGKGDFVYIPPGVPHLPVNMSPSQEAVALVARTDAKMRESAVLLPELDNLDHTVVANS